MIWWMWAALAFGQDALSFSAVTTVQEGQGEPSITFEAGVSGSMTAEFTCGGRTHRFSTAIRPGGSYPMELPVPPGSHTCRGNITLIGPDGGESGMPLNLQVAKLAPIQLGATLPDLDLSQRTLQVHADRPVASCEATLIGLGGAFERVQADLSDPTLPRFSWSGDQEVLKIEVVGDDGAGFQTTLTLSPWSYAIPHEDVIFESGSDVVREAEAHKLESTWGEIEETLAKYGSVVEIELYVAGYTDTVGDAGSNQALSQRRARAIAAWFRKRGFTRPIHFQGFGEDALAVSTGDGVNEARNRRAVYVLAAQRPAPSHDLPRANWSRLP